MSYLVIIEQGGDGTWSAFLPDVPGCVASADSPEELRHEIKTALELHLQSLRAHGEALPEAHAQSFMVKAA